MTSETRDRALLERLLRDPAYGGETWAGYALGDLDDAFFPRTRWLLDEGALLVVFRWGESGATALPFGDGARFPALLRAAALPPRFDLHVREADAAPLLPHLDGPLVPHVRLGLTRERLRPVTPVAGLRLARLRAEDAGPARALYDAAYPGNIFDPQRLVTCPYLGAWDGGELVAVAGTHVLSARTRVAAVGDVVTRADRRGRGVGAWLTAALCERLLERADRVVLNVARDNAAGLRAYERVGFGEVVPHLEGAGVWLR